MDDSLFEQGDDPVTRSRNVSACESDKDHLFSRTNPGRVPFRIQRVAFHSYEL